MAPLPTKIIGFLLALICAAAALMRSGSGCGAGKRSNTFAGPTSARCVNTSQGISSEAGPRRPDSISWKARPTMAGATSGYSMRSAHFTNVRSVASWSGISCRWPRPLPRNCVGTCPVRQSTGSFDPNAVSSAAPALSTPGPGTTLNTPGLLVACANHLQLRLLKRVEQAVDLRAGQAEHGVDTMRDKTVHDRFAAGS